MDDRFSRLRILIGDEKLERLHNKKVCVLGLGGVGGSAVEALVRFGIINIRIVDNDIVTLTNLNRQLIATENTIGQRKTEAMKNRILEINPNCNVEVVDKFIAKENVEEILSGFHYVLDCIDTVTAKLDSIEFCMKNNIKIISAMGAGNKLDPTKLTITDISKTSMCPLAKVMRRELRNRGINHLKVVYSTEKAIDPMEEKIEESQIKSLIKSKRKTPGSTSFVPPVSGIMMASYVINDIIGNELGK